MKSPRTSVSLGSFAHSTSQERSDYPPKIFGRTPLLVLQQEDKGIAWVLFASLSNTAVLFPEYKLQPRSNSEVEALKQVANAAVAVSRGGRRTSRGAAGRRLVVRSNRRCGVEQVVHRSQSGKVEQTFQEFQG